jgi:hypothetical protein
MDIAYSGEADGMEEVEEWHIPAVNVDCLELDQGLSQELNWSAKRVAGYMHMHCLLLVSLKSA